MRARLGGLDDHRDTPRAVGHERCTVEDDPASLRRENARERYLARSVRVLGAPEGATGHREHGRWQLAVGIPVAVGQFGEPTPHAGRERLDVPLVVEHDQPRSVRAVWSGGFADDQAPLRPVGEEGRHALEELELVGIERGLPRLAIEGHDAPCLSGKRPEGEPQLLLASIGLNVEPPAATAARMPGGRPVDRRQPARRASDVGQAVKVVLVVLVCEPLGRKLSHAGPAVARDQQRLGIEREPAGRLVMRHGADQDFGALVPEHRKVKATAGKLGYPILRALLGVPAHVQMLRPRMPVRKYHLSGTDEATRRG